MSVGNFDDFPKPEKSCTGIGISSQEPEESELAESGDSDEAVAQSESGESAGDPGPDRWSGTLSRDWSSEPATDSGESYASAPAPVRKRIDVEEAVQKIPPEAIAYLRDKFKTDIHSIRAYESHGAKN